MAQSEVKCSAYRAEGTLHARSALHLRSILHVPLAEHLVEKDQVDFDLVFFWLEWMGNSASLRDSLALRLASELADLRAANANHQLVPLAQA